MCTLCISLAVIGPQHSSDTSSEPRRGLFLGESGALSEGPGKTCRWSSVRVERD